MGEERIVAVGLVTKQKLLMLGRTLAHAWPVDDAPRFDGLLEAIDAADRNAWRHRERSE